MSVPLHALQEFHRDAQGRVHALTAARDYADSARRKIGEAGPVSPVLSGLTQTFLAALEEAHVAAVADEMTAANRARDAWTAEQSAAKVADAVAAANKFTDGYNSSPMRNHD